MKIKICILKKIKVTININNVCKILYNFILLWYIFNFKTI